MLDDPEKHGGTHGDAVAMCFLGELVQLFPLLLQEFPVNENTIVDGLVGGSQDLLEAFGCELSRGRSLRSSNSVFLRRRDLALLAQVGQWSRRPGSPSNTKMSHSASPMHLLMYHRFMNTNTSA